MDPAGACLEEMFQQARSKEGIATLAQFLGLCVSFADRAQRHIGERIADSQPLPAPAGPLLATAREAAATLGPSWSARKIYRITPTLPPGCAIRKGGRLYFHLPTLKQWAAQQ